jgi:hypothetical protein
MPPEVREEIERHEREILEEDEREERERRNEVRRLRLSELEGALFLIVTDYNEYSTRDLIESLYRVKWDALGPLQRRRYRGRLRARLHSLNCKLKAARQKPLRPSKELNDTRPLGASPLWATVRTRRERERETLASCENEIRKALAGGEMNSWEFNELLQDQKGYRPGTLKRARKRLGVRCKREGYGTDGGWLVYLPPD